MSYRLSLVSFRLCHPAQGVAQQAHLPVSGSATLFSFCVIAAIAVAVNCIKNVNLFSRVYVAMPGGMPSAYRRFQCREPEQAGIQPQPFPGPLSLKPLGLTQRADLLCLSYVFGSVHRHIKAFANDTRGLTPRPMKSDITLTRSARAASLRPRQSLRLPIGSLIFICMNAKYRLTYNIGVPITVPSARR